MIRGWYHNNKNGARLLSFDEIAEACCVSSQVVKNWFADKIGRTVSTGQQIIDAADVIWFLVKNSLPVAPSLLPPNTKKILFIANDEFLFQDKCEEFDQICRFLAGNSNILVETAVAGKAADLVLLTFSPNLVVLFLTTFAREIINTIHLLTSFPELKIIVVIDDSIRDEVEGILSKLKLPHLIVADTVIAEELIPQLEEVFDNS